MRESCSLTPKKYVLKKKKIWEQSSKIEQSVYICHTIMKDCSNFWGVKIPLKPDKSYLKSELSFLVGFMLHLKLSKTLIWKREKEMP